MRAILGRCLMGFFKKRWRRERLYPGRSYRTNLSVEDLLKWGTDPNALEGLGTPYIVQYCSMLWIAICGSNGLPLNFLYRGTTSPAFRGIRRERPKDVQLLLEYGADPNVCTQDKTSILHAAAFMCHPNIVAQLSKWGATADSVGPRGLTALHVVARQITTGFKARNKRTVDAILQAPGIDVNARDEDGRTPLSIAAELGGDVPTYFVQKVLENFDADINIQDISGKTALYHAVEQENTKIATLLLSESHINPNLDPVDLPLFLAVPCQRKIRMPILLSTKAIGPNQKENNGRIALKLPTSKAIARLLIKAGADLDIPDSTGLTARQTLLHVGIKLQQHKSRDRRTKKRRWRC